MSQSPPHAMFCYQCEQTSHGSGCTTLGVCGKEPDTAALQDVMVHIGKGICQYARRLDHMNVSDQGINDKVMEALFMTLTNVNFDTPEHVAYIKELTQTLLQAKAQYQQACSQQGVTPAELPGPAQWQGLSDAEALLKFAETVSIETRLNTMDPDIGSLVELLTYGVKGMAAYAHHAKLLGYTDPRVGAYINEAFDYMCQPHLQLGELLALNLKCGEMNLAVMALLDQAHTETFGHPVPTVVPIEPIGGKAIVVSGHDLKSLYELLKQTEGKGINVYTHGELLPANAYPKLRVFSHLVGNYGGAWQNQQKEFDEFPGAIVMTTNCLKPPAASYKDRLFTMDVVGFEGVRKITNYDFSAVIDAALKAPGYPESMPEPKTITIGFGHNAVLGVADKVIDAVKAGQIKHFFLVGGCDGAEYARNYFSDFAESAPKDSVIMTLGCGKFRFNKAEFGDIGGIPRLLDLGQCNDAYSAVKIATALAEAFGCGVNDLPLSLIISWFEQKAVAVLLTLLHLGIKNIRIGPNLPAFITPNVLALLVSTYDLKPIGARAKDDLNTILAPAMAV